MPERSNETRFLWYVDGAKYEGAHPAVPTRRVDVFYLPKLKRSGVLGVSLFASQSEARRVATENAKAQDGAA